MIAGLIRAALTQRVLVAVVALMFVIAGLQATRKLAIDAFPDVTNIQVQIATDAPGRSPEEVERFITAPIEIGMTGIPGLTEMRSLNKPGLSLITLVFTDTTKVYFARQLVSERLVEIRDRMPVGVTPVLGPVSTGLGEIYQYTLEKPTDAGRALTVQELTDRRTIQDWVVRPQLRSIPGVAEINSQGGYVRQYQVMVDPDRLRHFGLTVRQVYEAVSANNANAGGGVLAQNSEQFLIRGLGLIQSVEDFQRIVIRATDGVPVFLRQVADVKLGSQVRVGSVIKNGTTESVGAVVMMIAGGNAKEIVGRVKERVNKINSSGMLPDGLQLVPYYDRSELIDAAVWTVSKVLAEGVVLVILVLFLFLGDVRSSLIVVATLILTPLITFLIMNAVGLSANLMSLGGLAIAIGLMVDGSVVVVENAFSRLSHAPPTNAAGHAQAILKATVEVATPVIFGVGIIILVFLPLMTLTGMEGKMFAPLAYTIAIALAVSLVLSLSLTPVLSSFLLRGGSEEDTRVVRWLRAPYRPMLAWSMGHARKTVVLAIAFFGAAVALVPLLGTAFIPEMKEGSIVPGIIRVPNISLEESTRMEMRAMQLTQEVPGVLTSVSAVGRGESPADPQSQNESSPIVSLKPRDQWPEGWTQETIQDAIREKLKAIPGVNVVMAQPISARVAEMVTGVRSDVAIKVFGDDLELLLSTANNLARVGSSITGARDMRVEKISGQQYLTIDIDRAAIARHGINVADVNDLIEVALGGQRVTDIYEGARRFAAAVRVPERFRNNPQAIGNLLLTTPGRAQIPLESIARIEVREGPAQISRELGRRRIVVGMNVHGRDLGGFVHELQTKVAAEVTLPSGYTLEWGGQFQNMERALGHLAFIIPITIAAIYFLLFMLFNSLRLATLIISVLPLASIGGVLGLFISGEYLSVPASVGFIALWGIAVLNGVVLVSAIRERRQSGMGLDESIVEGAQARFRPVMITATVAMLGLIPFLFSVGPGSEVQRPLAVVVIGGLITSTLLTLVMLPAFYRWFDSESELNNNES